MRRTVFTRLPKGHHCSEDLTQGVGRVGLAGWPRDSRVSSGWPCLSRYFLTRRSLPLSGDLPGGMRPDADEHGRDMSGTSPRAIAMIVLLSIMDIMNEQSWRYILIQIRLPHAVFGGWAIGQALGWI